MNLNHERALGTQFPAIGQVYYMNFQSCSNGQNGWRPGIICQNNVGNKYSPNIVAIPLTTSIKRLDMPTHVVLDCATSGLSRTSMAICENLHYLSKEDIGSYITTLPELDMQRIACAVMKGLSVIAYLSVEELITLREQAIRLNHLVS